MSAKILVLLLSTLVPWLVWIFGAISYYSDFYFSSSDQSQVYDFIVVGGGAAGAVVAHRLSTTRNWRILLLEAGGDPSPLNGVPGIALDLLGYPETDWMHNTVPQKYSCFGLNNNESRWAAGKVLGGSTTLNFMFYLRGHPLDYDAWANLTGDPGWSYEEVLPYFKKSIGGYKGGFGANTKHYSESPYGFLNIEGRNWLTLHDEFLEAGGEGGFPTSDVNGGHQRTSFGIIEATQKKGVRFGTYASLIDELEKKPNVFISRYSHVSKVKLDKSLRAVGVYYSHHGFPKFATARKEVILSAGAVNSPKILMLSGIGPKDHLDQVRIKTRVNLWGVGKNLHDHVMTPMMPFVLNESVSFLADRDMSLSTIYNFSAHGQGPLTVPNGIHSQIFYTSSFASKDYAGGEWPDVQGFYAPAGVFGILGESFCRGTNVRRDVVLPLLNPHVGSDGLVILMGNVRPKSRGSVTLKDKNPNTFPLINPNYFKHDQDVKALVEGMMKVKQVIESSSAFGKLGAHLPKNPLRGCEGHELFSSAYWECYARSFTLTIWHPVGTCRMGDAGSRNETVVDTKLRVHGVEGLRVIDASIMPQIVNANTQAPTMMIGEKGSDFIREYWSKQFLVCDLKAYLFYQTRGSREVCYYSFLI